MTTLTLLLLALGKAIEESGQTLDMTKKKIMNYYLVNNEEEGELYHNLILTQSDKDMLINLILDKKLPEEYSPRVYENYNFLRNPSKQRYRSEQAVSGNLQVDYCRYFVGSLQGDMLALFEELSKRICNLDSSVRMEFKKLYLAFKTSTNFVQKYLSAREMV